MTDARIGELAGLALVTRPGILAYTHVFGVPDGQAGGFWEGEPLSFRVDGLPALAGASVTWADDREVHGLVLNVIRKPIYLPVIGR